MLKEMRDTMYSHINKNCRPPTSSTELFNKRILSTRLSMTTQLTKQKKKVTTKKSRYNRENYDYTKNRYRLQSQKRYVK